jgi:uncharacterized protein YecA (UPF0149 family)
VAHSLRQHKLDEINTMSNLFEDNRRNVEAIQLSQRATKPTKIPRNAQCPCNSGQKYKRCCGKNAPAVHHAA